MKIANCIEAAGFKGPKSIENFVFPSVDCYSYHNPIDKLIYQFILKSAEKYFNPEHNRLIEGHCRSIDGIHVLNPDNNIALEIFMWCGYPVISMVSYPSYIESIKDNNEGPFIAEINNVCQQRINYLRTDTLNKCKTLLYAIITNLNGLPHLNMHYRMATLKRLYYDDYIDPMLVLQFLNCITNKFLKRRNFEAIEAKSAVITANTIEKTDHAYI